MNLGKRILMAALLLGLPAKAAIAADLKGSLQEPASAANDWHGFYAGITLGSASGGFVVEETARRDQDFDDSAFQVGSMAGYNFSSGPFVWGLEADLQSITLEGKSPRVRGIGDVEGSADLVGSLRLRAGYAFDTVLVYATAGAAFTDAEITSSKGGTAGFSTGLALGLGAEWAFDPDWTARAEAMAYAFGEEDAKLGNEKRDAGAAVSALRLGLARRF